MCEQCNVNGIGRRQFISAAVLAGAGIAGAGALAGCSAGGGSATAGKLNLTADVKDATEATTKANEAMYKGTWGILRMQAGGRTGCQRRPGCRLRHPGRQALEMSGEDVEAHALSGTFEET